MIDFSGPKCIVLFSKFAEKQQKKLPHQIQDKLSIWARAIELNGIAWVRQQKGYHDEPLKGSREGQRSIRLNKAYRAIYIEQPDGTLTIITVLEVNKHEY